MSDPDFSVISSPSPSIYVSSNRIRKKPSSCSSQSDTEEAPSISEQAETNLLKPATTPSFSRTTTPLNSPTARSYSSLFPSQPNSMARHTNVNIHSIFSKLNTLNEKTRHDDKRSFLHSIKGHMRRNSKEKFHSLFDPGEGSPLNDTWRGTPLPVFTGEDSSYSPTLSPRSPLDSPTVTAYPTFAKSSSHSKKRLVQDNTIEEIAREIEQYYVQNNQRIEQYIDQIATLEKQKRDAVQESNQWKKKFIQAENQSHQRELELKEELQKFREKYLRDLDGIKRAHRKKCQQYGDTIKKLMTTNESFRSQLQESGIAPITSTPMAGPMVDPEYNENHEYIKVPFSLASSSPTELCNLLAGM
ncbi:hypothetical protein K493DRAFT_58907 [Basidiobolus meristosporus CBS 931.73]|uniref:Uncharacterized protein n=1 Tax=Basidiobolus meristosporus CBS 931.73 TaxID=1314790 RepID=A0A1Y1XXH7_9FUNG|nr:hypothetical protein K493DRAFT_58907 [Basidiobolus meristosporus CBS 931.73]|eukprot:ORX90459.1 hypothetical protein K493DRAFT_58907 [Basidiobolus meristosporus CBS 931.73]